MPGSSTMGDLCVMGWANPHKIVVLRLKDLTRRIGLSRATVYNLLNEQSPYFDALFAQSRIKLSKNAVGFVEYKIDDWLPARVAISKKRANH